MKSLSEIIIGKWVREDEHNNVVLIYIFREDGTFVSKAEPKTVTGRIAQMIYFEGTEGNYSIVDNKLYTDIRTPHGVGLLNAPVVSLFTKALFVLVRATSLSSSTIESYSEKELKIDGETWLRG